MNRPSRIFNIIIIKRDERNCDLHNLYKIMREIKKRKKRRNNNTTGARKEISFVKKINFADLKKYTLIGNEKYIYIKIHGIVDFFISSARSYSVRRFSSSPL